MSDGKGQEIKGHLKGVAGALTGDDEQAREGRKDQAEGNMKQAKDKLADAVQDAKDALKKSPARPWGAGCLSPGVVLSRLTCILPRRRPVADSPPRRHPAALRSRGAIIAAAHRTLSSNPRISLTDIAVEAGVGRATLYRHFPTRDVLLDTLIEDWRRDIEEAFVSLPTTGTGADVLRRMTEEAIRVMYRHRGVWDNPEVQERRQAVEPSAALMGRWQEAVRRGRDDGSLRTDVPPEWMLRSVFATMGAAITAVAEGVLELEEAARCGAQAVVGGMGAGTVGR